MDASSARWESGLAILRNKSRVWPGRSKAKCKRLSARSGTQSRKTPTPASPLPSPRSGLRSPMMPMRNRKSGALAVNSASAGVFPTQSHRQHKLRVTLRFSLIIKELLALFPGVGIWGSNLSRERILSESGRPAIRSSVLTAVDRWRTAPQPWLRTETPTQKGAQADQAGRIRTETRRMLAA